MGKVIIKDQPLILRLAMDRLKREDDIPEDLPESPRLRRRWKGQHIGRLVLAAKAQVEGADMAVIGEDDADLGLRRHAGDRLRGGANRPICQAAQA